MTDLKAHFALLKELEQENQDIETALTDLMSEMGPDAVEKVEN